MRRTCSTRVWVVFQHTHTHLVRWHQTRQGSSHSLSVIPGSHFIVLILSLLLNETTMSWIRHVSSTQTADEFRFTGYYWGNTPSGGATLDHLLPSLLWSLLLLVCYSSICNNFCLIFSLSLSISWFEIKKKSFYINFIFFKYCLKFSDGRTCGPAPAECGPKQRPGTVGEREQDWRH